ncbi:MAG: hypothetical protein JHC93_01225 [Parachlamydiales bacterium]|nr:hypothetical protein [Parachlamydiales bacterium]
MARISQEFTTPNYLKPFAFDLNQSRKQAAAQGSRNPLDYTKNYTQKLSKSDASETKSYTHLVPVLTEDATYKNAFFKNDKLNGITAKLFHKNAKILSAKPSFEYKEINDFVRSVIVPSPGKNLTPFTRHIQTFAKPVQTIDGCDVKVSPKIETIVTDVPHSDLRNVNLSKKKEIFANTSEGIRKITIENPPLKAKNKYSVKFPTQNLDNADRASRTVISSEKGNAYPVLKNGKIVWQEISPRTVFENTYVFKNKDGKDCKTVKTYTIERPKLTKVPKKVYYTVEKESATLTAQEYKALNKTSSTYANCEKKYQVADAEFKKINNFKLLVNVVKTIALAALPVLSILTYLGAVAIPIWGPAIAIGIFIISEIVQAKLIAPKLKKAEDECQKHYLNAQNNNRQYYEHPIVNTSDLAAEYNETYFERQNPTKKQYVRDTNNLKTQIFEPTDVTRRMPALPAWKKSSKNEPIIGPKPYPINLNALDLPTRRPHNAPSLLDILNIEKPIKA